MSKLPIKPPEDETDADLLKNILANARRLGEHEYADRVQRRIWAIRAVGETELERRFNEFLAAYESFLTEKNERTTRAMRTIKKVQNRGIKQTLTDWALSVAPTPGFKDLIGRGYWRQTAEYLVVSMPDEFPPSVVVAARKKLVDAGVILDNSD